MAETPAQADNKVAQGDLVVKDLVEGIKKELDVLVKPEPHECVICVVRSNDTYDIYATNTTATGISLHSFLLKFTNSNLAEAQHSKYICKNCHDLVNLLEQAEIEYLKLKETFESILSKNPLFESPLVHPIRLESVKNEIQLGNNNQLHTYIEFGIDSEDEPLSVAKKKRHRKPKKKALATGRRKVKPKVPDDDSWDCNECGLVDQPGGKRAASAHKTEIHSISQDEASDAIVDVKKEDTSDGSQTFNNGFDSLPKMEFDDFPEDDDDDNSSNYIPEEETPKPKKNRVGRPLKSKNSPVQKKTKKRERVIHKCDQCDAKYSSLARLEQHKLKHDGSKPPYICEVCGAHYKHKRACDIHIALHKGISDWKCEECNKLFPSKGALARHNNIHTGKLNYQCDLCGKSFIHTSSFKMHKLSHSGLKPHACDVCGLALMTRSHLKRHKRVHSGEKRHECGVCGKRFSERYNLAAHSKSHESAAAAAAPPPPRRHLFRCPFCPDRFERRYMLERHTSVVHGRALERPPPTPRNTMSKLLKAQAARRPPPDESDNKDDRSSDSRSTPVTTPQKLLGAATSWSSAYTEFNLRADFPH
ncbi:unnamed protein product [Diatraea saccharalis]|uniref:C2H2-type domain-containing protein n=1 Tax=Diatraea saccharalis TaxID=40085 RepID=A0A9N9QTI1_9NEOP|nr:unnamed protein product [Diatraea saccharalis]